MTDKEIKEVIQNLNYNIQEYDEGEIWLLLFEEDYDAFNISVKALETILEIRNYAEKTENSELREMLRLD
jgi:hypothetical protein